MPPSGIISPCSGANLAQTMLAEGRTVTEVQELLGFSSYAYFFKFFKKMIGISPSQYRKDNTMPLSAFSVSNIPKKEL